MKKFNRLIALVILMGICFPMISPISNVVYAVEDTQKESDDIIKKINDIKEKLDKLEKETENLSKETLAESLLGIKEEIDGLDQDALDELEESDSELLKELSSKLENIQELLNKKEEEENTEEPKEEGLKEAKPIALDNNIENKSGEVEVSTFEDLKKEIVEGKSKVIEITKDIQFKETIVVDRDVNIKGISKDITLGIAEDFDTSAYIDENNESIYLWHFVIQEKAKVDLENLIFTGSKIKNIDIGGIINLNILNLRSVEFNNMTTSSSVIVNSKELNIYDGTKFSGNYADYGGAISNSEYIETTEKIEKRSINIYGEVLFEKNSADKGGAIGTNFYGEKEGELNIKEGAKVKFIENEASSGGAIYNQTIKISGNSEVEFINNKAVTGGAILLVENINIFGNSKVKFTENKAEYGGAISTRKDINVSENAEVEFIRNEASSGGAIYKNSDIIDEEGSETGLIKLTVKDSGKVLFKENSALLEMDGGYPIGEGGAINGVNIYNKDNGNIEFIENKAIYGGAIYSDDELSIISDSSGGILFKDNEINESEEDGLDIFIGGYPNIDLANVSFINKSTDYSNIFLGYYYDPDYDYESSKGKPELALNLKKSYIDSGNGFIKIGQGIAEALSNEGPIEINMDNIKFENIKSVLKEDEYHGGELHRAISLVQQPSKKDIKLGNLYLNMKNSSIETDNLKMIEKSENNELSDLLTINSINNTYDIKDKLSLNPSNTDNNLIYNTIKAKNIEDFNETIFKNNLLILDENTEFAEYLGTKEKWKNSKEEILYKGSKISNLDINKKSAILRQIFSLFPTDIEIHNSLENSQEEIDELFEKLSSMYVLYGFYILDNSEIDNILEKIETPGFPNSVFEYILTNLTEEKIEELKKKTDEELKSEINQLIGQYKDKLKTWDGDKLLNYNEEIEEALKNKTSKEDITNIYILNSNTDDLNNTLEKDTFEYKKVGSINNKDNKGSLNHYRPVENSLAMGFDKIAGIDKDAIDEDRKLVTMGSIENAKKIEEPEKPEEPENPDSGGSSSSKKRRKKKEEVVIEEILLHKEYINGYPDNTVRPEGNLTREEASAILDRVTEYKPMTKRLFNYPDVENNRWSYNNIENLSNKGGIKGYPDGEFKPVNKITRAEAATILVRLENAKSNNKNIPEEIKNHWAKEELITAIEKGWIKGYEDGSIKADNFITRAEFVTLVNRMQNRKVKAENILENIKYFKDLDKNAWYYEDIVEAANTHNYKEKRLEDGSEKWTSIIK